MIPQAGPPRGRGDGAEHRELQPNDRWAYETTAAKRHRCRSRGVPRVPFEVWRASVGRYETGLVGDQPADRESALDVGSEPPQPVVVGIAHRSVDGRTPASLQRVPNAIGVCCEPWSCTTPGSRRCQIALFSASSTNSVRRWLSIDQPTTRRLPRVQHHCQVQKSYPSHDIGDVLDPLRQLRIPSRLCRWGAPQPCEVAAGRETQHPTHSAHRPHGLIRLHEPESSRESRCSPVRPIRRSYRMSHSVRSCLFSSQPSQLQPIECAHPVIALS